MTASRERFLRRALLLPVVLPLLVGAAGLLMPGLLAGVAVLLVGSLSYGGVAYVVFALAMYWWTRNWQWAAVRRLALVAPVLFAPLAGVNMVAFFAIGSTPEARWADLFLEGVGFALIFGYAYVLLVFAAEGLVHRNDYRIAPRIDSGRVPEELS